MSGARKLLVVLALGAGTLACSPAEPPPWNDEVGYRWRELEVDGGEPGFTPVSSGRTGIRFQNTVGDSALLGNRNLGQGAGVCLGDVDDDGSTDIFFARTEGPNVLYRNRGGWRFEDITDEAGVAAPDRYSSGCALADTDGDADLDLILLATTGPNAIFINDGAGRFMERRLETGLDTTGRGGTTIAMADVDGDGDLDLYVANYKPYSPVDAVSPQGRAFSQIVRQTGPDRYEVVPEHRRDFKLVARPEMGGVSLTMRAEEDHFYLNEGGRFSRVPIASDRFREPDGRPLASAPESFALAARFADLDGDRAPDLYIANDFEDPDLLWMNDGLGGFTRADWTAQRQLSSSSMGVDVGDIDNDGLPDLFVVDMLANDSHRLRTQLPTHTALPKQPGDIRTQLQQQRNTLFRNRGDGTFAELALAAGVAASGWSWSTMFLDVDLDGWQDILITNGHLWDVMDADTQERLQGRLTEIVWQRMRWEFPPLPLRNVAFRNRGDLTFEDAGERWRFGVEEDVSHALAAGDLDGDGDLDVVVSRLGSPALVMRNDAAAPRVAVRLVGDAPNTHAIGAKVRLLGGAVPLQEREIAAGGLYLSHSDHQVAFAMGDADSATLAIDWRDGRRTIIERVRPNRLYEITPAAAEPRPRGDTTRADPGVPLFVDATEELRGHVHTDPMFDDWERQFLLPNSLSQLGPGVAWFDMDRDGDEDLAIGAGRGGRLAVFRNDGGRLVPASGGPVAPADLTTILGLVAQGGSRLLAGIANWESPGQQLGRLSSVVSVPVSARGAGAAGDPLVPARESSTGPMALADYDGDGDLDLFVGGRAIGAAYPRSASSALYRNTGGAFVLDTANAPVLREIGLVSAALFADIDGDANPDLLLAREWDSILLLLGSASGRFTVAPGHWGLSRWSSRWNGIATGDLDGDGRLDIVATSWGRNTMTPADSARPLVLLHGPFGSAGEEEMLIAREDPRIGGLAPLNGYPRVRIVLPELTQRLPSFAAYADATVDRVLGAYGSRVTRREVVTLDHMLFMNRGDRLEPVPLPAEAQLAPAFYAGIADFDGDGDEDVFLSQNFFPTAVGLPRYDAGRGLLLAGNGRGALAPVSAASSGVLIYGDQRGAAYADIDRDGRLDLAVAQNGAATRLLRNRGARPGLRVRVIGRAENPDAIGAQLRVVFGERKGPVREIQAGSGYWSQNGAVQVFGRAGRPTAVRVRWPGGEETVVPVADGARETVVSAPPAAAASRPPASGH